MVLSAALAPALPAQAFSRTDATTDAKETTADAARVVALSALPKQAQDTHRRILAGGPFRFDKDGTVFGNRERQLPRQTRGYYREYTVAAPGARSRGARRIVCGGLVVQSPETCFYTQDHYQSFQKIDPRH
ncbi:MAG TPA: ribonuclease [Candidatus Aquabacterium excrementipullorum]|nr:ribonuclease [Candidatus Aquabacterium excrementipullorum]